MEIKLQHKKRLLRPEGSNALRVTYCKAGRKGAEQYRVKCGCCEELLYICCPGDQTLEIGGVDGSIKNWREILLPLLQFEVIDGEIIDVSPTVIAARHGLFLRDKYRPF